MSVKIDRNCPFYRESQKAAYYTGQKNLYMESQIVNVDCILFMDQIAAMEESQIGRFADAIIGKYGTQRPTSLLADYIMRNSDDSELVAEGRKYFFVDNNLCVRFKAEPEKVDILFQSILQQTEEERNQYRLFDEKDCEPFEGEKSLGRILVVSVDDLPYDLQSQESQLAVVTPELLDRPIHKMTFVTGNEAGSIEDMYDKIIGVLKEDLVPRYVRDILQGKSTVTNTHEPREPLEIDRDAPLYLGKAPTFDDTKRMDSYLESMAANIAFIMELEDTPENDSAEMSEFVEDLLEAYGAERPVYLLAQYFNDEDILREMDENGVGHEAGIIQPNIGYYVDGRINTLYSMLKGAAVEMDVLQDWQMGGM